jgi:hypothetical protein
MTGDLSEWEKERVVSLLWVTYPGKKKDEEWSHCMGDLPRKNDGLIVWVTILRKMMVSLYG